MAIIDIIGLDNKIIDCIVAIAKENNFSNVKGELK